MSKNIEHLQHIKSNVVIEGKPKLPTAEVLVDGELAVNYAEGYETISLRNSNSGITTFSSDDYYSEKKLGYKFIGENSANTVSDVIDEDEEIVASALNDLNTRKLDVSAYTPTDLTNYYTKSETSGATEISNALNELGNTISSHTENASIHVAEGGEVVFNLTGITSAAGGTNLCASWSGNCEGITELYDGMNIQLRLPSSGHTSGNTISINGGDKHRVILNASTSLTTQYPAGAIVRFVYDANQSGSVYTGSSTPLSVQGVWKVSDYNTNTTYTVMPNTYLLYGRYKAYTNIYRYQLLVTKDEEYLLPINTENNVSAGTKTLTTEEFDPFGPIYLYNVTATTNANAAIASARTYQECTVNLAYSFNTTNTLTPYKSVYMVVVPQSNGKVKLHSEPITQTLPTTEDGFVYIHLGVAYSNTSIALEMRHTLYEFKDGQLRQYVGNYISESLIYEKLGSGFTGDNSANTVTSVIEENEEIVASALNDLESRKLDASAYTPTDLSNYYTKSETSGATEISAALNGYADSVKYNSTARTVEFYHGTTGGTKVFEFDASAFIVDGMVDNVEVDDVVSGSSTIKCLVISFNTDAGKQDINIPISDIFNPDIYYTKDEIDNSELVISSALNDLESRKLDASAYTPTDLTNYYTKSQTSGATEISTALGTKEDTVEIDSTVKTSSFDASVGKYYVVNVPNDGSVTVTLPTSNISSTNVQNIIFLVKLGSGDASITFTPIAFATEGFNNMAASSTYEVNALWNGTNWIVAMTKLEAVQ